MVKKNTKFKISVIIPCYNQGKYLDDAVNSVLRQTYQDFEIIVINDGSTDKYTNDLLKNYNKPKTEVYSTKNQGLASTRNYGFKLSKGEFIQFLDADDILDSKKFEKQINIFRNNDSIDVSYSDYTYYYEDTKEYSEPQMKEILGKNPFEDFVYKWQRGISIPIHCSLFRRKVFNNSGPFISGFKAIEDWIMWVDISSRKCKFQYLDENLAVYRIQQDNMTKNESFMIYWVARAISYIAHNYIISEEMEKFNFEQEKYLENLIRIFFLNEIEEKNIELEKRIEGKDREIREIKEESIVMAKQIEEIIKEKDSILNSKSYKLSKVIAYLPTKIGELLK